jgi:PAP2 superfamily
MRSILPRFLLALALAAPATATSANVIVDWDTKAIAVIVKSTPGPLGQREAALVNIAMFDAVNAIDRRYRPYVFDSTAAPTTSPESAAAAAAATVLVSLHPESAEDVKAFLSSHLTAIPAGEGKAEGIKVGEAAANRILEARASDGATGPDAYQPKTTPGQYVPTAITVGWAFATMKPFALAKPSQIQAWAPAGARQQAMDRRLQRDQDPRRQIKRRAFAAANGGCTLLARGGTSGLSPAPTTADRQQKMSVVDSARFMAIYAMALSDAYASVLDAKYRYEFWRPITAIRNGGTEANSATPREATWQPIDNTPLHPEYPCAHCISAGAAVAVIEAVLGSKAIPELSMTSATAPGVTHRWTSLDAFCDEVSNARVWAGFHYRNSTAVGSDMGRRVGDYVAQGVMQPVAQSTMVSGKH